MRDLSIMWTSTYARNVSFKLLACVVSITISILWLDDPIALWCHDISFLRVFFQFVTQLPQGLSPFAAILMILLFGYVIKRNGDQVKPAFLGWFFSFISMYVVKTILKGMFGRTWPETWIEDGNLSLIHDGIDKFYLFSFDFHNQSFPSGHAAYIAFIAKIVIDRFPMMAQPIQIAAGLSCLFLIGTNCHYLSDIMAGLCLGWAFGCWAKYLRDHVVDLMSRLSFGKRIAT
jgi:membrane-associated phospholipid phosphatase